MKKADILKAGNNLIALRDVLEQCEKQGLHKIIQLFETKHFKVLTKTVVKQTGG